MRALAKSDGPAVCAGIDGGGFAATGVLSAVGLAGAEGGAFPAGAAVFGAAGGVCFETAAACDL